MSKLGRRQTLKITAAATLIGPSVLFSGPVRAAASEKGSKSHKNFLKFEFKVFGDSSDPVPGVIAVDLGGVTFQGGNKAPVYANLKLETSERVRGARVGFTREVRTPEDTRAVLVSMVRALSNTSAFLNRTPSSAPRPDPTMIAVGVARPRAHGQAMISTATALRSAVATSPLPIIQPTKTAIAIAMTTGTKTPEILSARRCTGALEA